MRAYGLAFLLLLGLAGLHCKSSDSGKSGPAGNVVVLLGEATASSSQRGDRKLAIGDLVYRDDRIATFANTTVEIRLLHNGALWSLRGAREVVVGDSPAWRAERASADFLDPHATVDKTGAAGRHAEREAAEDPSGIPGEPEAGEPAADLPDDFALDESKFESAAGGGNEAFAAESVDDAVVDKEVSDGLRSIGSVGRGGGSGSGTGYGSGAGKREQSKSPGLRLTVSAATGALNKAVVRRLVGARRGAFAGCAEKTRNKGRLSLEFTISEQGTVPRAGIELAGDAALLRELGSCVEKQLAAMTAPPRDGETLVEALVEVGEPR